MLVVPPPALSHLGTGRREVADTGVLICENQIDFLGLSENTVHLELFSPVIYSPREICARGEMVGELEQRLPKAITQ